MYAKSPNMLTIIIKEVCRMKICKNKKLRVLSVTLLIISLCLCALIGIYNCIIPSSVSYIEGEEIPQYFGASVYVKDENINVFNHDADSLIKVRENAEYRLLGILPIKTVKLSSYKNIKLYPGGMPFGIKFFTSGVLVVGLDQSIEINPAYNAGIRQKDIIIKAEGKDISCCTDLTKIIEACEGKEIEITFLRNNREYTTRLIPILSEKDNKYKSGIMIRDSGAGIGTVTFIDPETCMFGGLGHGICDNESGELIPIQRGSISDVIINGIVKGVAGDPGEIKGYFQASKTGSVLSNNECGIFGIFNEIPKNIMSEPLSLGLKNDVKEGKAYIYTTLDTNKIEKYEIEISAINRNSEKSKSFTVTVTDPALLEKTGGIVQGMSGSPIIQNGKLVGAVTHVLINDPTTGYGIFIENMLNAAQIPMAKAS